MMLNDLPSEQCPNSSCELGFESTILRLSKSLLLNVQRSTYNKLNSLKNICFMTHYSA